MYCFLGWVTVVLGLTALVVGMTAYIAVPPDLPPELERQEMLERQRKTGKNRVRIKTEAEAKVLSLKYAVLGGLLFLGGVMMLKKGYTTLDSQTLANHEEWMLEAADIVIKKKSQDGLEAITPLEQLIYCLWIADYSLRNAGDLVTAYDLYPAFQQDAVRLAGELNLPFTQQSFSLSAASLQQEFAGRFERICNEVRNA